MGIKNPEESLAAKRASLEAAIMDGELAAVRTLKALAGDKTVDANVRLSASHLLLQARTDLKGQVEQTVSPTP